MNSAIDEYGWLARVSIPNPDHLQRPALEGPSDLSDLDLVSETDGEAVNPGVDGGEVLVAQPVHICWGTRRLAYKRKKDIFYFISIDQSTYRT